MTKSHHTGELVFFWLMFAAVGYLAYGVMSPYVTSLFLAVVFGIVFAPLHRIFRKLFKHHENISAFFTVLVAVVVVLIPVVYIGVVMSREVLALYASLSQPGGAGFDIDAYTGMIEGYIRPWVPGFELHADVTSYLKTVLSWVANNLNIFFSSVVAWMLDAFIIVVAMFFLYRDGRTLHAFAVKWSPLADDYDETIIGKLEVAVTSVVKGSLVTAVIQGALVSIGFMIFGVSNPVLWGVVSAIFALLPLVGTGLIVLPASAYFFFEHQYLPALLLTIWWALAVAIVEHVIKPILMQRDMDIHPFAILLSVLGGLVFFGPVGFLAGPIVIAFFFALLDIYPAVVAGRVIKGEAEEKGVLD